VEKGYGQIIPKDVTHEANGKNTTLGSRNAKSSSRRRRALLQHTHNIILYARERLYNCAPCVG